MDLSRFPLFGLVFRCPPFLLLIAISVLTNPFLMADNIQADMKLIKDRFVDELLERSPYTQRTHNLMNELGDDGSWPNINYEDTSRIGFQQSQHMSHLIHMARSFRHPDSPLRNDERLLDSINRALDFWLKNDFRSDNWWWNQMGIPRRMVDFLLLMEDFLNEDQIQLGAEIVSRANMSSSGARPGGDRLQVAVIMGKGALIRNDPLEFQSAREAIEQDMEFTEGPGLQYDFSLQHREDRVTSTLTYGYGFIQEFADFASKIYGTPLEFKEETLEMAIDFYLEGIHKSTALGRFRDPQQLNRGISRFGAMHLLSSQVPLHLRLVSNYRAEELDQLIAARRREAQPDFSFNKYFWRSAYFTHQRQDYFTSVRMFSVRNRSVEQPHNQEGLKNHFLADGSNFLIRTGTEYERIFPAYDWRKIPGTTVVQKKDIPHPDLIQQNGKTTFVGGLSDGTYGIAAFDFDSPIDDLQARKAWFFFDREYVALGAGIQSNDSDPVATTLDQRALRGEVHVHDGRRAAQPSPGEQAFPGARWIWHDNVGYLFGEETHLNLRHGTFQGTWRSINRQHWSTDEIQNIDLFTAWIDHGSRPRRASYSYVVVPSVSVQELEQYQRQAPIEILSNTPQIQAVSNSETGIFQFVFYERGRFQSDTGLRISVEQPCLLMFIVKEGQIQNVVVADPARQSETIRFTINAQIQGQNPDWDIRWSQTSWESNVRVTLPTGVMAGKSAALERL